MNSPSKPTALKLLAAAFGLLLAGTTAAETWRFAAIGDTPYSDYEGANCRGCWMTSPPNMPA
jgi:hypothetical protein